MKNARRFIITGRCGKRAKNNWTVNLFVHQPDDSKVKKPHEPPALF